MNYRSLAAGVVGASLLVLSPLTVLAADIDVTCDSNGDCTMSPANTPLFTIGNLLPGESITRTVDVTNNASGACTLGLRIDDFETNVQGFQDLLFTVIASGGDIYGASNGVGVAGNSKSMGDIPGDSPVLLGDVDDGTTRTYDWTVTLDPATGNAFQGASILFNFDMLFDCPQAVQGAFDGGDGPGDVGPDPEEPIVKAGKVAGASTSTPLAAAVEVPGSVLGAAQLAATGTAIDKLLYALIVLGTILTALSGYGWFRNRHTAHATH